MKSLYETVLEGAGHAQSRLGAGSSGVAYDLGNGYVRKTMRVLTNNQSARRKEFEVIEKWGKVKAKDLRVIPPIKDVEWDGYTMEKLECPCEEGQWIAKALNKYLFYPSRKDWKPERVERLKKDFGEDRANFVMSWLDDFMHDFELILGSTKGSDDIRSANIGKDKHGNIKCFDWFNTWG